MIREHRQTVVDRLSRFRVVDDRAKVADVSWPAPWIVLDFPPSELATDRWEASSRHRAVGWFQTSCVGEDDDQAGMLHDAVTDLLLDWSPAVPGWPNAWPLTQDTLPRLLPWDTSLPDRHLVQVVTRWTWHVERPAQPL